MAGSTFNTLCIRYHKEGSPGDNKTLMGFDKDGLPTSAEYYDDVWFFRNFQAAAPVARDLIEMGYLATIMKCNRIIVGPGKKDRFWLT